jgi:hypothetical protein
VTGAAVSCAMTANIADTVGQLDPEPVGGFTKALADQETVISLWYAHSIGRCDNYNMMHLELALFVLKHDFCQLQITLKEKSFAHHVGVKVIFLISMVFFLYVQSVNFSFFVFSCFRHIYCVPTTAVFLQLLFSHAFLHK